jgi:hypothetical protein
VQPGSDDQPVTSADLVRSCGGAHPDKVLQTPVTKDVKPGGDMKARTIEAGVEGFNVPLSPVRFVVLVLDIIVQPLKRIRH